MGSDGGSGGRASPEDMDVDREGDSDTSENAEEVAEELRDQASLDDLGEQTLDESDSDTDDQEADDDDDVVDFDEFDVGDSLGGASTGGESAGDDDDGETGLDEEDRENLPDPEELYPDDEGPADSDGPDYDPADSMAAELADGAHSERTHAEADDPDRMGGFQEFDTQDIMWQGDVNVESKNAMFMEKAELGSDSDAETTTVYITHYDDDTPGAPDRESAQREMGGYAALREMGVRTPKHSVDTEEQVTYSEGVDGLNDAQSIYEVDSERAEKVDPDELKDQLAAQALVGNDDLHSDNIHIGADGEVYVIDMDLAGQEYNAARDLEFGADGSEYARAYLSEKRADDALDLSNEEIAGRAQELAVTLEETGKRQDVVDAAARYDDAIGRDPENRVVSVSDSIENNIETALNYQPPDERSG